MYVCSCYTCPPHAHKESRAGMSPPGFFVPLDLGFDPILLLHAVPLRHDLVLASDVFLDPIRHNPFIG